MLTALDEVEALLVKAKSYNPQGLKGTNTLKSFFNPEYSVASSALHSLWHTISFVMSCGSYNTWAVGFPGMVKIDYDASHI